MADINIGEDFLKLDMHRDWSIDNTNKQNFEQERSIFQYMEYTKFDDNVFNKPSSIFAAIEQRTARSEQADGENITVYYDKDNRRVGNSMTVNGNPVLVNYMEYGSYESSHGTMNEITNYRCYGDTETSEQASYTAISEDGSYALELLDYDGDNRPDSITQIQKWNNMTFRKDSSLSKDDKDNLEASIKNGEIYKPRTDKLSYTVENEDGNRETEYIDHNNYGKLDIYNETQRYENGMIKFVQQRHDGLVSSEWYRQYGTLERKEYTASNEDGNTSEYSVKNYDEKGNLLNSQLSNYTVNKDGTVTESVKYVNAYVIFAFSGKVFCKRKNLPWKSFLSRETDQRGVL